MKFLVISQRAKANPNYNLKDLTGNGRFDIVPRCILAAGRRLLDNEGDEIIVYMKDGGWIHWLSDLDLIDEDEISVAHHIKENWNDLFIEGDLSELLERIEFNGIVLLSEDGERYNDNTDMNDKLIILGAQRDLTDEDIQAIEKYQVSKLSLGESSMLASHTIIFLRQLLLAR